MLEKINKNICTVTTEDIRNYLADYREEHGVSKATIDGIRRNLSSIYHWLEEEDYIFVSPIRKIHKIKITKKVKPAYSDEELEKLRDGCKYLRDLAIVEFLFSTGVRIGELVKLNRNDVNFEERECKVLGKGDKERDRMYTQQELDAIDRKYFAVIIADQYDVTLICWTDCSQCSTKYRI